MKLFVSLSLLTLLFWRTDLGALLKLFASLRLSPFLAALLLYTFCQILSTYRWQLLLKAERIRVPMRRLVPLYFEGMFFNLFLPTLIGGDLVRGHRIYRHTEENEASLASILVERLTGLASLLSIALLALLLGGPSLQDPVVTWPILSFAGAFLLGIVGVLSPKVESFFLPLLARLRWGGLGEKLIGFHQALQRYRTHTRAIGQAVAISLFLQAIVIFAYYLASEALGLSVPLSRFFLLVPLVVVIAMIPISIGGLGVREGAVVYFFGKVGVDPARALGLSLTWFLLVLLASLPGGVLFALGDYRKKAADPPGG